MLNKNGVMGTAVNSAGFTLVEVMLAVVLVGIVAIGGSRYSFLSAQFIQYQKDARVANVIATSRMEQLLARPYADYLSDLGSFTGPVFMKPVSNSGKFSASRSDPGETVVINHSIGEICSKAQFMTTKNPGTTVATTCVELEVSVKYGPDNKRSLCIKNIQTY